MLGLNIQDEDLYIRSLTKQTMVTVINFLNNTTLATNFI